MDSMLQPSVVLKKVVLRSMHCATARRDCGVANDEPCLNRCILCFPVAASAAALPFLYVNSVRDPIHPTSVSKKGRGCAVALISTRSCGGYIANPSEKVDRTAAFSSSCFSNVHWMRRRDINSMSSMYRKPAIGRSIMALLLMYRSSLYMHVAIAKGGETWLPMGMPTTCWRV